MICTVPLRIAATTDGGEAWSTDSSSDEEFSLQEQRHLHHPSVLNLEPIDEGDPSFEEQ
ncbi:hypothetical protein FIBSPDRAFT_853331, partial [Athelia psychrophila]